MDRGNHRRAPPRRAADHGRARGRGGRAVRARASPADRHHVHGTPNDVFSHAAQRVDAHAAELQRLLDATSHAFTRGKEPAARTLGVQFDVQCAAVQQALGGLSRLLSNKQVLEVLLREEGARQGAEKARAKLGRERALV